MPIISKAVCLSRYRHFVPPQEQIQKPQRYCDIQKCLDWANPSHYNTPKSILDSDIEKLPEQAAHEVKCLPVLKDDNPV
jgi:hypothetical protein